MKMAIHKYWGLTNNVFPTTRESQEYPRWSMDQWQGSHAVDPQTPHTSKAHALSTGPPCWEPPAALHGSTEAFFVIKHVFFPMFCLTFRVFGSMFVGVSTFLDQSPRRPHLDQRHGVFGHTAQWARRLGGWLRVGWYVLNSYYRFSLDPHTTGSSGYSGAIWNLTTSNAIILFEAWRLWGCNCSDCNLSATASSEYQSFLWSCQAQLLPTKCTITHFINMVQWITLALFESSSVCGKCCKLWQLRRQRREMFLEVEKHLHGALLYKI